MYAELKARLASLPFVPSLRVIRLGEDPASVSYVRLKDKKARELGLRSQVEVYPEDFPEEALLERIALLNADPRWTASWSSFPSPPTSAPSGSWRPFTPSRTWTASTP